VRVDGVGGLLVNVFCVCVVAHRLLDLVVLLRVLVRLGRGVLLASQVVAVLVFDCADIDRLVRVLVGHELGRAHRHPHRPIRTTAHGTHQIAGNSNLLRLLGH